MTFAFLLDEGDSEPNSIQGKEEIGKDSRERNYFGRQKHVKDYF